VNGGSDAQRAYPRGIVLAPDEAIGGGPYIHIGLPSDYVPIVPLNATRLLDEWEAQLDPLMLLRTVASRTLGADNVWHFGDSFVEPSPVALSLIREAATDHEVIQMFDDAQATLATIALREEGDLFEPVKSESLRRLLIREERDTANPMAASFLLGMGVVASIDAPIGFHGRGIREALENRKVEAREAEQET
jgi:hypothetical protein